MAPETLRNTAHPTPFVLLSWGAVGLMAAFIFFMSSNSDTGLNQELGFFSGIYQQMKTVQASLFGPGVDLLSPAAHFLEYAALGCLGANALRCHMPLRRACLLALLCGSLYGITDEFHQYFVPGRLCDPLDWLVDTCGTGVGSAIAYGWLRRRAPRRQLGTGGIFGTR